MPLFGGFRIGRWFGFPIRIDVSWFVVAALVVWTFSASEFPLRLPGQSRPVYLAMGTAAAVLFFLSVLLHELAHAVVARARGVTVDGITLFIFGGIAQAREEAKRPLDEFLLTAAGPLSSLALAGVFFVLGRAAGAVGAPAPAATVLEFLAVLNLVLAVFNMIPGFPLDGGRIFRSLVWAATGDMRRATRWASWGGRLFGGALIGLGVAALAYGFVLGGLWSAFIGWFLMSAARTSYRQFELRRALDSIPVERVMVFDPVGVSAGSRLDDVVERVFLRGRYDAYPVEQDGTIVGVVTLDDVADVPRARRGELRVSNVMRPTWDLPTVDRYETLAQVAGRLDARGAATALVLDAGRVVGLLDLRDLGRWVSRLERLGLGPDGPARPSRRGAGGRVRRIRDASGS